MIVRILRTCTKLFYPQTKSSAKFYVSASYLQTEKMTIYGEIYNSLVRESPRANHIIASWFNDNGIALDNVPDFRPALIRFFLKHTVELKYINGEVQYQTYLLACVSWFKAHEQKNIFPRR